MRSLFHGSAWAGLRDCRWQHWDRVFERFYKVDASHSREVPGSGLGLSIVRHLALALGGRAWTETARDGGQVFGIAIPLSDSELSPPLNSP